MPPRRQPRERSSPAILVYNDRGVSLPLLRCLLHELRLVAKPGVRIETVQAKHLRRPGTLSGVRLLVIPGGRDLPYRQELDGEATRHIRDFVAAGGSYLGLCAGAYFACESVRYEGQSPALPFPGAHTDGETLVPPIAGPRELALIAAEARVNTAATDLAGAELDPMSAEVLTPVGVARVLPQGELKDLLPGTDAPAALCWLGPAFHPSHDASHNIQALATDARGSITIARSLHGSGITVACGVHPEVSADGFRETLMHLTENGISYDPARAARILADLDRHESGRRELFKAILRATDVGDLML